MRLIISAIHYPVCSARYMAAAFRRLGHEVRTLGDSTGNRIPWPHSNDGVTWTDWTELDPRYAWQSDGSLTTHWPDWTPQLVIHMDSAFAYHHPVYADVPHILFGADNHVRDYNQGGIARYFLMHRNVTVRPYDAYNAPVEHLPCAYDPIFFTPSPIPWARREYDVCMIGVLYPQRLQLLNALADAGLKVLAGTGWVYEQYRNAYWNSRISLCASANGDLAQRVFETAAMGCAVLTDPLADLQDRETNKKLGLIGYVTYGSADECIAQARELLSNEEIEHAPIADGETVVMELAGGKGMGEFAVMKMLESVWGKHSWDRRAARICEWWEREYGNQETAEVSEAETQAEAPTRKADLTVSPEAVTVANGEDEIIRVESVEIGGVYANDDLDAEETPAEVLEPILEALCPHGRDPRYCSDCALVADDLDAEVHAPAGIEELPEPAKPKRKRKRGQ